MDGSIMSCNIPASGRVLSLSSFKLGQLWTLYNNFLWSYLSSHLLVLSVDPHPATLFLSPFCSARSWLFYIFFLINDKKLLCPQLRSPRYLFLQGLSWSLWITEFSSRDFYENEHIFLLLICPDSFVPCVHITQPSFPGSIRKWISF